jgi:cytochrome P450
MTQLYEVTAGRALTTLPGPRGLPLVGNLFQLKVTQLQTILEHWADTYGPLYTFRLGRKPVVVLAAPDLIQTVLRQRPETFRRLGVIARVLEDIGGNGLFAAEGTAWRRQRRVVMPALSTPQVRQFFPTLTTVTAGLKSRWDRAARTGEVVDMPADLLRYTIEVITRVTFGDDLPHELAGLPQHLGQIFALINRRILAPWPAWQILTRPADRAVERAIAALRTALATALAQCRARVAPAPTGATPSPTLVEALLAARDEAGTALRDDEILGNVFTLVLDVALPDLNGLDVQQRLVDRTDMPIIFITGYGDVPMTVQAMKAGAVEFLTKPFDDDVLLSAIQHAIERSCQFFAPRRSAFNGGENS